MASFIGDSKHGPSEELGQQHERDGIMPATMEQNVNREVTPSSMSTSTRFSSSAALPDHSGHETAGLKPAMRNELHTYPVEDRKKEVRFALD